MAKLHYFSGSLQLRGWLNTLHLVAIHSAQFRSIKNTFSLIGHFRSICIFRLAVSPEEEKCLTKCSSGLEDTEVVRLKVSTVLLHRSSSPLSAVRYVP